MQTESGAWDRRDAEPRTLVDVAVMKLREAILGGDFEAGSRVQITDLAEHLGMSAIPVREALRHLEQSGLVERQPHRGVSVSNVSVEDLEDTYAVRLALEPLATRLAAARFTEERFTLATEVLARYEIAARDGDEDAAAKHHRKFHFLIYDTAESKWLSRFLPALWDSSERYRRLSVGVRGDPASRLDEHKQVLLACRSMDTDRAEEAMRRHLGRTKVLATHVLPQP